MAVGPLREEKRKGGGEESSGQVRARRYSSCSICVAVVVSKERREKKGGEPNEHLPLGEQKKEKKNRKRGKAEAHPIVRARVPRVFVKRGKGERKKKGKAGPASSRRPFLVASRRWSLFGGKKREEKGKKKGGTKEGAYVVADFLFRIYTRPRT